jgi:hypothetical protein
MEDQENTIIVNSYGPSLPTGCNDCTDDISNYLEFTSCFDFQKPLYVSIDQISPTPVVDEYYFLEYVIGRFGETYQSFGCFQFTGRIFIQPGSAVDQGEVLVLTATTQTDCETCLQNSAILYVGVDCLTENQFIIALPSEGLENHLITYTGLDGFTQYCGVISGLARDGVGADVLLVSVLGLLNETNTCEDCLVQVNEKKELINCIDPNITEVVWASVLFEPENSTHLSFGDGCYRIGDTVPPETPITITELANFDPQQNCEDCLECHGVIYDYTSCGQIEVCGVINNISTSNDNLYYGRDFVIDSSDFMFIPFRDSNVIGKYNLTTQTLVNQSGPVLANPQSLDIDETNGVICVSNTNYFPFPTFPITFFDYTDLSLSSTLNITGNTPNKVYFNPNDSYFYVTTTNSGFFNNPIYVYSGLSYNTMSLVGTFGINPSVTISDIIQIGSFIYVLNQTLNCIEKYTDSAGGWSFVGIYFLSATPSSFSYNSSSSVLYISVNNNYYIKFDVLTDTFTLIPYTSVCTGGSNDKIKYNSSTNRLYITGPNCNVIYEFNSTTDTLINTYNNLFNDGISNVYGIGIDSSNNVWFGSYNNIFQLGCTTDFVSGKVTSNELLTTGTTFFNYSLSACCAITSVQSITDESFLTVTEYLSMLHFEDCETCLSSDVEVFVCRFCDGGFREALLISSGDTHDVGDIVRSQYGNSDFVCLEIIDVYTSDYGTEYPTFVSDGNNYTSCEECSSGSTLGLTIINCDTLEPLQVNVSLSEWLEISGLPSSIPNGVISDSNGVCYQVANACPIDNNNPPFEISNFYYNQSFCRASNREPNIPRNSGVEVTVCVELCDQSVVSVIPPHPEWTDGYGTQVTQLNMITIGGPNGLNN